MEDRQKKNAHQPWRRSMRKDLRAFCCVFLFHAVVRDTQTSFFSLCCRMKWTQPRKYAKYFIQHEMKHNNSSSSSRVYTFNIIISFLFSCSSASRINRANAQFFFRFVSVSFARSVGRNDYLFDAPYIHAQAIAAWIYCVFGFFILFFLLFLLAGTRTPLTGAHAYSFSRPKTYIAYVNAIVVRFHHSTEQQH